MKYALLLFFLLNTGHVYADTHLSDSVAETIDIVEQVSATPKVTVKEIKNYLSTVNPDSTCMDEYLHRRKQLITKLALTPAMLTLGTIGSVYVGGMTGVLIANARWGTTNDGWGTLGYAIGGVVIGGATYIVATGVSTTLTAIEVYDIDLVMKALGELHLNKVGEKSDKLYAKYSKYKNSPMSKEEFFEKLKEADTSGALCDGSMVKQPRIHLGSKLKYEVAKSKDLIKSLSESAVY
jgi:hypothetical protein